MHSWKTRSAPSALAAALWLATPGAARAFPAAPPGSALPDRSLPALAGGRQPLLAEGKTTVFVFFRPGQDTSQATLRGFTVLQQEFRRQPVRFVAVASPGFGRRAVEKALRSAQASLPVLLDEGDALYAELGVTHYPAVGIASADRRLSGYQPWMSVHHLDSIRARIRYALGEIDEVALTAALDPDPSGGNGGRAEARARLDFAKLLLASGRCQQARLQIQAAERAAPPAEDEEPEAPLLCAGP